MVHHQRPGLSNETSGESIGQSAAPDESAPVMATPLATAIRWRLEPGTMSVAGSIGAPGRPTVKRGFSTAKGKHSQPPSGCFSAVLSATFHSTSTHGALRGKV